MSSNWFSVPAPNPAARLRLFCLPYAGGAATIYRQWPQALPPSIEVVAIELPGRGRRFTEPLQTGAESLVDGLLRDLPALLDRPAAIFGYSMGALLAYELAQALKRRHGVTLAHLLVAAAPAPHLPRQPIGHDLPPAAFRAKLEELNGTPSEVLDHPELYALVEPILRADFKVCDTYPRRAQPPLEQPLTVFGGLGDTSIPGEDLAAWRETTSGPFAQYTLPGDHFFIHSQGPALLGLIARALA